jgi:hypothetical protein
VNERGVGEAGGVAGADDGYVDAPGFGLPPLTNAAVERGLDQSCRQALGVVEGHLEQGVALVEGDEAVAVLAGLVFGEVA